MDRDRASPTQSDYSEASVASLGPSIQAGGDLETTPLIAGDRTFVRLLTRRDVQVTGRPIDFEMIPIYGWFVFHIHCLKVI